MAFGNEQINVSIVVVITPRVALDRTEPIAHEDRLPHRMKDVTVQVFEQHVGIEATDRRDEEVLVTVLVEVHPRNAIGVGVVVDELTRQDPGEALAAQIAI